MTEVQKLTNQLAKAIEALPIAEKIEALNEARKALHAVSPFASEPVDLVLWVPAEKVTAYDEYENPNAVAPPEMALLIQSVEANGYTMPIVTHETDDSHVVVDGMHRRKVGTQNSGINARIHGHLPVTHIRANRSDVEARIAQTVQHNRARGEHGVSQMSALVRMLNLAGWKDEKIQKELGMEVDEVLRLKQITGLAALFANRDFSEAWEVIR